MSSFMMYVAVVGAFPAWANTASGLRTDATTRTFNPVFFIASLPDICRHCGGVVGQLHTVGTLTGLFALAGVRGYCIAAARSRGSAE
jgi:hypothetical protein